MHWQDLSVHRRLEMALEILGSLALTNDAEVDGEPALCLRHHDLIDSLGDAILATIAMDEIRWRGARRGFVPSEIYGEPGWVIMLDLFVNRTRGRNVSVTSACVGSGVPPTTALRYITLLDAEGFVFHETDHTDGRRRWIRLTPTGLSRIRRYLFARAAALPELQTALLRAASRETVSADVAAL